MSKPVPGVYGDWICMTLGEQWHAYCDLEQRLATAEAERDEARQAARWCYGELDDHHSQFDAEGRWPWLKEVGDE